MRLLIVIGLVSFAMDISACSCNRIGILKGQKKSDIVFVGQVIRINELTTTEEIVELKEKSEYRRVEFIFKITSVYKGRKHEFFNDTLAIVTTGGEADCGNWFDKNKKYLVYSYRIAHKLGRFWDQATDPFMTTSVCTRTKKVGFLTFFEKLVLKLS